MGVSLLPTRTATKESPMMKLLPPVKKHSLLQVKKMYNISASFRKELNTMTKNCLQRSLIQIGSHRMLLQLRVANR